MGGALGVTSDVDCGSTFWVELAVSDAPQPRVAASRIAATADSSGQSETTGVVLYIEDNQSNVRLMQRVLQRRPAFSCCMRRTEKRESEWRARSVRRSSFSTSICRTCRVKTCSSGSGRTVSSVGFPSRS